MIDPGDLRDVFDRAASLPPQDRAAFLARACGDNVALREQVERLLAADACAGSVFDSSSDTSSSTSFPASAGIKGSTIDIGARLGPYVVTGFLGAGGMGEVYRAHDTRLERSVAIKVLPAPLVTSSKARQRFEREARAIAALSHPHICPVFDVGRQDDRDYLVMEHLAGETLAARLRRGPMPVPEAVATANEIAGALMAAHRAGIVHRDLKPGNVMLTEGGARLLDFGLASHPDAATHDATAIARLDPVTHTGTIAGTLPYMAPEQIEGRPIDARTDIFAFGAVLYEMLTGRRAFKGSTQAALVASILRDDPPSLRAASPTSSPALERVIGKCLMRDPDARWQSAEEVQAALAADQPGRWPWIPVASGLVVTTLVAIVAASLWRGPQSAPHVIAIHRLSHDALLKETPYSDGKRVIYTTWNTGFAGNSAFQLPAAGGESVPFRTSLKNPYLYDLSLIRSEVLLSDGQGTQLYTMPLVGGQPRPVGEIKAGFASISRDGRQIVFGEGTGLFVASVDGSQVHKVLTSPSGFVYMPRWSADGRRIRYTIAVNANERGMWEVSADGTGLHHLLPGWKACCGAWTPDGRYYVFEAERDGEYGLWTLADDEPSWWRRRTDSQPVKLTTGPMRYENAMPGADGSAILALGTSPSIGQLVRFEKESGQFVPMLPGLAARDMDFTRDGQWITYVNNADTTIWRSRSDGSEKRQLTFPPAIASHPRWSPDGRRIVYCSSAVDGPHGVFVLAADGGQPTEIGRKGWDYGDPTWSSDGGRLVFAGSPANASEGPSRIQIADLGTRVISTIPGADRMFSPRWSPDGASIVALSTDSPKMMLYEFATGRWKEIVEHGGGFGWPCWTADSRYIQAQHGTDIVRVRVADGQVTRVVSLEGVHQVMLPGGESWIGFAPDGAPLLLREVASPPEIYAFVVDWP
jgi:serine/threonine protein kinase/Tol biopolymer transport system component